MQTATLFDPDAPTVRDHDPVTSRQAPGPLGRNRGCAEVLVIIAAAGERGATCADVLHEMAAGTDRANTARRLTDLLHAGLIDRNGTTRARRGGRPQQVNHITADGRALIADARHILAGHSADRVAPTHTQGGAVSRAAGERDHAQGRRAPLSPPPGREPGTAAPSGCPTNEHDPGGHPGAGSTPLDGTRPTSSDRVD